MIALDTNILVYAHRAHTAQHSAAARALQRASQDPNGWGFALPVLAEFWKVVTSRRSAGGPSSARQAAAFLEALFRAGAICWLPSAGAGQRLVEAAKRMDAVESAVFDLQIALICRDHGARELWTADVAFPSVSGLRVVNPLAP